MRTPDERRVYYQGMRAAVDLIERQGNTLREVYAARTIATAIHNARAAIDITETAEENAA